VADSTFGGGRPGWLGRLGHVRNVIRQHLILRKAHTAAPDRL
jgi:hypothetical protein